MKKTFFLGVMLLMAASTFAARYYVMGDDRAIPLSANTSIMEKTELMLWIRDWGDQSLTCSLETSADAGPSGYTYAKFLPHADNSGNVGGYYGITWAISSPLDLSAITEDWKMVIVTKTDVPFWTIAIQDDKKCNLDIVAMLEHKDNVTWNTVEIPMYDIFDKGISFASPLSGYLFNMLTNDNTATTEVCIDAWYFTDGKDEPEAVENVQATVKAQKAIVNGQMVILKNGVRYNALGAQL